MVQETRATWTPNRILALILGIVFTVLGVVGFFTPTENGTGVIAVFGIFDADTFGNIFYLITGLLGIAAAGNGSRAAARALPGRPTTVLRAGGKAPCLLQRAPDPLAGGDPGDVLATRADGILGRGRRRYGRRPPTRPTPAR